MSSIFNEYNDLYVENMKYNAKRPKSFEKEEMKKLILNSFQKMECLFTGCSSLKSLPDISKWNIKDTI